ncbi:uncharacterized protein LOC118146832 [Callithrix jacchus]
MKRPRPGAQRPPARRGAGTGLRRRGVVDCGDNPQRWLVPARLLRPGPGEAVPVVLSSRSPELPDSEEKALAPRVGPLGPVNVAVTPVSDRVRERGSPERSGGAQGLRGALRRPRQRRQSAAPQPLYPAPALPAPGRGDSGWAAWGRPGALET